jgi:Co/Zn/Cd efflux system component
MTATQHAPAVIQQRRDLLARRIRLFVTLTISWNVIEAVVALTAGARASSSALIGFGLDSVIEVSSAAAVAWQFAGRDPEAREKVALRVIAFSFFGLAAFVTVDALRSLLGGGEARHSTVGLVLAALSLAVMPLLSYAQRRAGRELGSRSAVADSKQTLLCTYLSAVLLVGLVLNSLFGWSWADPIAALVIAGIAVKEGLEAWRGDSCACGPAAALHPETGPADDSCGCGPGCADACCTDTGGATKSGDGNSAGPLLTIGPCPEPSPTGNE